LVYPLASMDQTVSGTLLAAGLFAAMLCCLEVGRRVGLARVRRGDVSTAFGAVEGAIFALFGLLLAFTFSGAAARFDARRMHIADEANAIGTAYLRLDLLPADEQPAMRQRFRDYLDSRIDVYRKLPDVAAAVAELARSGQLQSGIWTAAVPGTLKSGAHPNAAMLLIPALNEMFDITTTRTMAARTHPPGIIYMLLFMLGLGCAVLAGHAMAGVQTWSWLHAVAFAFFISLATYVIVDVEYPRAGFLRLSEFDQVLVDLRESMK
jgi:hypothetical protein